MKAARKEAARDTVEIVEVAKAGLDHGEQMLAIACQKALRLASIEGGKLLRELSPCLRLVIVRVGDEMDLDAPLVAAHCDARTHTKSALEARDNAVGFDLALALARSKNHRIDRRVGAV